MTGTALGLRDGGDRFAGAGVQRAVRNVNERIEAVLGPELPFAGGAALKQW
jgi:enolase